MKNQVQFQKGYSLIEFQEDYGTKEQCEEALFRWKFPQGYVCPKCGSREYCQLRSKKVYQCNKCHHQHSLTSQTILASTKLPLKIWFLGMYLVSQAKTGISALELRRQLGVSYNTAWAMKQKIMHVMKTRDDEKKLEGLIQLDDVYWGGAKGGGKRGRGSPNKVPFVAAVSLNEDSHPISMNMNVVDGFKTKEIKAWAEHHLSKQCDVVSDGLACFRAVEKIGCTHTRIITGGGTHSVTLEQFAWVNTMIANVKTAIIGVYHAIQHKHLPRYLAEFCYRFNRRFQLDHLLPRLAYVAVRTDPMPYRLLKLADDYG